jgi:hypothetical protein
MPPSTEIVTQRPDLADSLMEFDLDAANRGFIGTMAAPILGVAKQSGVFGRLTIEELLKKRPSTRRGADGRFVNIDGEFTTDSYATEDCGVEERVDLNEAQMYGEYYDAEELAAKRTRDTVLADLEQDVVDVLTADRSQNTDFGTDVDDWANATPIKAFVAGREAVRTRCGVYPNAATMDATVFQNLRNCAEIIARIGTGGDSSDVRTASIEQVKRVLELDFLNISGTLENTADEGQDAVLSAVFPATEIVLHVVRTDKNVRMPQSVRTFHWDGARGSGPMAGIETYYSADRDSDIVRARMHRQVKLLYPETIERLTGVDT